MRCEQTVFDAASDQGRTTPPHILPNGFSDAQLLLVFGSGASFARRHLIRELQEVYPAALIAGCTTAGEILDTRVYDDTLVATAIQFERTEVRGVITPIADASDSYAAGRRLADSLEAEDLVHALVFSEGLHVNGSALVAGLIAGLPQGVTVTGGLAADGDRFEETAILWQGEIHRRAALLIGLYGRSLHVGYGSVGGWDAFGPERVITRSTGNILYELDGRPALDLYKLYLGEQAAGLPASGLLFPLCLRRDLNEQPVVRTILGVDEATKSLTFAGDVPQGSYGQLMKANFNRLVDGASDAATLSSKAIAGQRAELALLISCVGRKLVLKQRVEEEVESVREVLGPKTTMTGFYSYGEISPTSSEFSCALHNQTMTITTLSEI